MSKTRGPTTRADKAGASEARPGPPRRILVIDDDAGFREGVSELLSLEGYEVSSACNAVEAVTLLPQFRPQMILLDLGMPLLDGEAFLRGVRGAQAGSEVAVVLISAKDELQAIARRTGVQGYLEKPFEAPALLLMMERLLRARA